MKVNNFLSLIILGLWLITSSSSLAQQQFGITLDRANLPILNPAAVDIDFFVSNFDYKISATYRGSWSALEGSPVTMLVRGESLSARDNVSVLYGVQAFSDQIGRFQNNNFSAKYAAIFSDDLDERGLSIGLSAQINQYRIVK